MKNEMSFAILSFPRMTRDIKSNELANDIKGIIQREVCVNGPYNDYYFNGKEANVIIYVTSSFPDIQTMSRATRLLILVTHSIDDLEDVRVMKLAVEQNLVKKYINHIEFTPLSLADQKTPDDNKWTSLHAASFNGNLQDAETLIAKGATIDAKTIDGETALHHACR